MTEQQIDTLARGVVFQVCPDGVTRHRSGFEVGYLVGQIHAHHELSVKEEDAFKQRVDYHRGIDK